MQPTQALLLAAAGVVVGYLVYRYVLSSKKKAAGSTGPFGNNGCAITIDGDIEYHDYGMNRSFMDYRYRPRDGPFKVRGVQQTARFQANPATGPSNLQWHHSWRLGEPHLVEFDTELDHGLIIGLSPGMSDTRGGILIHVRAKDAEDPTQYNYGISDMLNWAKVHTYASEKDGDEPALTRRTYWFLYDPKSGRLQFGKGPSSNRQVLFDTKGYPFANEWHNAPIPNSCFFGFGTSTSSPYGKREIVGVRIKK